MSIFNVFPPSAAGKLQVTWRQLGKLHLTKRCFKQAATIWGVCWPGVAQILGRGGIWKRTVPVHASHGCNRPKERRKKVDAHLEHTWNLLYVSANAAADAASAQLGMSKSELFGKDAENAAVAWWKVSHLPRWHLDLDLDDHLLNFTGWWIGRSEEWWIVHLRMSRMSDQPIAPAACEVTAALTETSIIQQTFLVLLFQTADRRPCILLKDFPFPWLRSLEEVMAAAWRHPGRCFRAERHCFNQQQGHTAGRCQTSRRHSDWRMAEKQHEMQEPSSCEGVGTICWLMCPTLICYVPNCGIMWKVPFQKCWRV